MPAASTLSPREVAKRFLRVAAEGTSDELADLYAETSVIEMPFGPQPGVPLRFEGREGHRARFKRFAPSLRVERIDRVTLHETADPEVVIVEYDYHATAVPTGRPFTNRYIMVMRIRDGLIVHSRDYVNPLVSAAAFGNLDRLHQAAGQSLAD
ncbi:nuclear transport factor 2 family protein [Streptomyces sp. NPDC021356]|uniref:nuclear transport factor 2 family protein n=1 Tax=Streptomyces sp. NPDC021356 TaxID=3154900 RepID=UPI0033EC06D6